MVSDDGRPFIANRLLEALSIQEQQNLLPYLKQVALTQGEILYEPGEEVRWIYFPTGALISLVVLLADGATTEFAVIGCDGIVGMPAFLGRMFTNRRAIV